MRTSILLTFAASQALAALNCQDFVPTDIGWSFNLASGYVSADPTDNTPDGSEPDLGQTSPLSLDGFDDQIFALYNCTDKALGAEQRIVNQCYPASDKKHTVNTTTITDFLQIQSNNNLCLTVDNTHKDQTTLSYEACNTNPSDLSQLFKSIRTIPFPHGTCSSDPSVFGLVSVLIVWEDKAYCGKNYHWHLQNDTSLRSEVLLKKNQASDERFVFFDEAG